MLLQFSILAVLLMFISAQDWNQQANMLLNSFDKDVTAFHNFLSNIKQQLRDQESAASSDTEKGKIHANEGENEKDGFTKTGGSKEHHVEKGNKLNSEKENRNKEWGDSKGIKKHHNVNKHHGNEHHNEAQHHVGEAYKDTHKYKKGNYQKGFREKYHLDETKKHSHFWKHADSHKKWKTFGGHESEHMKGSEGKKQAKTHKESSADSKDGKEGKKAKTILSSQSHGHKKEQGQEFSYAHEKKLHPR